MRSGPVSLYLRMELVDVPRHCDQDTFGQDIFFSSAQISPESHTVFYLAEGSFGLYAPVHPEHAAFLACDPLQTFPTFLQELL